MQILPKIQRLADLASGNTDAAALEALHETVKFVVRHLTAWEGVTSSWIQGRYGLSVADDAGNPLPPEAEVPCDPLLVEDLSNEPACANDFVQAAQVILAAVTSRAVEKNSLGPSGATSSPPN
jgi:hypothetical protein